MNHIEKVIDTALSDDKTLKLKFKLDEIHASLVHRYRMSARILTLANITIKVAATFAVLFFFVRAHYVDKVKYTKLERGQLINYYFKNNISSLRGNRYPDREIAILLQDYNYGGAIDYLGEVYAKDTTKEGALFYLSYSNMCAGHYIVAAKQYRKLADNSLLFGETAQYYLAGNYLLGNQPQKAERLLEDIAHNKGHYAHQAKSLIYYIKNSSHP